MSATSTERWSRTLCSAIAKSKDVKVRFMKTANREPPDEGIASHSCMQLCMLI
jgi:hypothetical protein